MSLADNNITTSNSQDAAIAKEYKGAYLSHRDSTNLKEQKSGLFRLYK